MTWIWIIVGLIAFSIIKFLISANKQAEEVTKQGGMRVKYRTLVNHVLNSDPKAKIFQETSTLISVGVSSIGGSTVFYIQQAFGDVAIKWQVDSPVFGKHKLEWTFDQFDNQNQMIKKIENDIEIYQKNVMQKYL